jgi:hypothetical protein
MRAAGENQSPQHRSDPEAQQQGGCARGEEEGRARGGGWCSLVVGASEDLGPERRKGRLEGDEGNGRIFRSFPFFYIFLSETRIVPVLRATRTFIPKVIELTWQYSMKI